jgi:hypothetical protein
MLWGGSKKLSSAPTWDSHRAPGTWADTHAPSSSAASAPLLAGSRMVRW